MDKLLKNSLVFSLIFVGILTRLLPHEPNMTAVGAVALFSGVRFKSIWAYLVPLMALLLSDLILGFQPAMISVYLGFFAVVVFAQNFLVEKSKAKWLAATVLSSLLFFVISNLAVWLEGALYLRNWEGLVQCYMMALPFLKNQLAADLIYSSAIFGCYYLVTSKLEVKAGNSFS